MLQTCPPSRWTMIVSATRRCLVLEPWGFAAPWTPRAPGHSFARNGLSHLARRSRERAPRNGPRGVLGFANAGANGEPGRGWNPQASGRALQQVNRRVWTGVDLARETRKESLPGSALRSPRHG